MAPESHMIALEIKKKHPEVKWIASFGDPLCDNPFNYFIAQYSEYSLKGKGFENISIRYALSPKRILKNSLWKFRNWNYKRKNNYEKKMVELQHNTLELADKIILNNPYQLKHMSKGYENLEQKTIVIPHTYDLDLYPKSSKKTTDKINITFIGHLDDIRTPRQFLKAVNKYKELDKDLAEKLEVNFYGNLSVNDKLYILDNDLIDVIKFRKSVTYLESLKIMKESDWLLHIDANLGMYINENIFFAAKIADYLGSKSNIFAITMDNGASADIMRQTNSLISSYSADEILFHLMEIVEKKCPYKTTNNSLYDIKNVVKKYDDMVKEIVK
jgi:hypothetical protein